MTNQDVLGLASTGGADILKALEGMGAQDISNFPTAKEGLYPVIMPSNPGVIEGANPQFANTQKGGLQLIYSFTIPNVPSADGKIVYKEFKTRLWVTLTTVDENGAQKSAALTLGRMARNILGKERANAIQQAAPRFHDKINTIVKELGGKEVHLELVNQPNRSNKDELQTNAIMIYSLTYKAPASSASNSRSGGSLF